MQDLYTAGGEKGKNPHRAVRATLPITERLFHSTVGVAMAERNKVQDDRCALVVDVIWCCTADKAEGINKLHPLRLARNEDG